MRRHFIDPFELLIRRTDLGRMLRFFTLAEERLTMAFPRAARLLAESDDPTAKQVRGTSRRHYLHEALLTAAQDAGIDCDIGWTDPPTWSFPVIKSGSFKLTIGIVDTRFRGDSRALRTTASYVAEMCKRNEIASPQGGLFDAIDPKDAVIPDASLGALIVAQYAPHNPDVPAFLGFWVPSKDLSAPYYVRSFEQIIEMLRAKLELSRRPAKRTIERKQLRRRKPKPGGEKA